jgi:hypothetical protein
MATGYGSTIGGGHSNRAQGDYSVIAGGGGQYGTDGNSASGISSAVLGGELNHADGNFATVGGGRYNEASGWASTVAGGFDNLASGNYSFAAGRQAQAYGNGSWVWGDATDDTVGSWNNNEFVVRASGGIYLYTNAAKTSGMKLTAGSSSWAGVSDSTRKRNIRLVDTRSILEKVTALPIKQWSYKAQDPAVEHVGPMAQDFWNQFHLGDDSLSISTIDPDGIALAAIQELQKQNVALQKRVEQLEHQLQQPTAGNTSADQTSIIQTQ